MIGLHVFDAEEGYPPGIDGARPELWLDEAELVRYRAYAEPRQREFLIARALVKQMLSLYGVAGARLGGFEGKAPRVVGSEVTVSWAHAGGGFAIAVRSDGRPVGVDIEPVRAPSADLVAGALADDERYAIVRGGGESFFRAWTAKEAFMKREGEGLKIDPRELRVDLAREIVIDRRGGASAEHVVQWSRVGRFVVAWM